MITFSYLLHHNKSPQIIVTLNNNNHLLSLTVVGLCGLVGWFWLRVPQEWKLGTAECLAGAVGQNIHLLWPLHGAWTS